MDLQGHFAVYRKIWLNELSPISMGRKFTELEAWFFLLSEAAFQDKTKKFNGVWYSLKRGEIVTSYRELASVWGWDKKTVANFIENLDASIDPPLSLKKVGKKGTILKINNYAVMQPDLNKKRTTGSPTESPTEGPLKDHCGTTHTCKERITYNVNNNATAGAVDGDHPPKKKKSSKTVAPESREIVTHLSDALKNKGAREGQFSQQWYFAGVRVADQLRNAYSVDELKQAIDYLVNHPIQGQWIRSMTDIQKNISLWVRRNEPGQVRPGGSSSQGLRVTPASERKGGSGQL